MEDSFDDELFADSEPSQSRNESDHEREEEGSQEKTETPIVKDELDITVRKTVQNIMESGNFNSFDVATISESVSKRCESNWVHGAEIVLAVLAEISELDWCEGKKSIIRFFCTMAVKILKDSNNDAIWRIIQNHCDQTCFCVIEAIRLHSCLFITECLRLVNERIEEEKESQEQASGEFEPSERTEGEKSQNDKMYTLIPRSLVERWAKVLSQRRADKSSSVRAVAVTAVGCLPHTTLLNYENHEFLANDMVLESMRDVDAKVREAAIKSLSILSVDHIETTINRLKVEEKIELRRLLAAKLIQEVHVMSFNDEQRASLLVYLFDNKDRILSRMARERLIPKWEDEQDGDSALNSLFHPDDERALSIYITTLFEDDLKKSESAFEFVEIIKDENPEMVTVDNWERSFTSLSASELPYGVLLLESVFSVLKERGELEECMTRIVPSLSDVCRTVKKVSIGWLATSEVEREEERLVVRVLQLCTNYQRCDSEGMSEWESLLRFLLLSPSVKPSRVLIEVCMDQLRGVMGEEEEKRGRMREEMVEGIREMVVEGEGIVSDDALKWRCSLILLGLVKWMDEVDEKTVKVVTKLMEETMTSEWDMQRELTCTIISIVGCLRKEWLEGTMALMLRTALQVDVDGSKIAVLHGLSDLISIHSPSVVARLLFPDWEEEEISREMKMLEMIGDYADPTSKSPVALAALHCTLQIVHQFCPPWPVGVYNLALFTTRENEGERLALEKAVEEELRRRTEGSAGFRLLLAHSLFCLIERQKGEEAYKCSITSTIMKMMGWMKRGGEGRGEEYVNFEDWLGPMIILSAIIQDPESTLNKQLVSSLALMKMEDEKEGKKMVVKRMEMAIDRLMIYEESGTSKALLKIMEKFDRRIGKRRHPPTESKTKKRRKRVKREEEESDTNTDTTHEDADEYTFE